ncbi:MAG: HIT domain-containing protein [Nocardioidaceae bacterium]|nr:HIT domain-containing protein [Nocardioidaceae bacterium]
MTDGAPTGVGDGLAFERLWTPHRMAYISHDTTDDDGCPFCSIPRRDAATDGADGLVVARGEHVYVVLNLHPYNPGHLMVLPYRHVAELEELTPDEALELTVLTQQAVRALKTASAPHAFNVGLNLGGVAGGSLSQHLHQHVVPRWSGDANFITVVGGTKVLPQLLEQTRDLLRDAWPTDAPGGDA